MLIPTAVCCLIAQIGSAAEPAAPIQYELSTKLAELANDEIIESSGIACSRRTPGVFWTHNDSGDSARLFAFNAKGENLGTYAVPRAKATDWEDMASLVLNGKPCLLVADVGDRKKTPAAKTLYLIEEPVVGDEQGVATVLQTVSYLYDDGGRYDCESVAFDPTTGTVLLLNKHLEEKCTAFRLTWPKGSTSELSPTIAENIATVRVPVATGMDISADGRRAIVCTYGAAYEFERLRDESWAHALSRVPRPIALPLRRQGEAICYGTDGKTIYLTSERVPTPFFQIRPKDAD